MGEISDQLVAAGVNVLDARRIEDFLFSGLILSAEDAFRSLQFGPQYDEEAVQHARNGWWAKREIPHEYKRILDSQTVGDFAPDLYELDDDLTQSHKTSPDALITHVLRQYRDRAIQWQRLTGESLPDLDPKILKSVESALSFVTEQDHPSSLHPIAIVKAYIYAVTVTD